MKTNTPILTRRDFLGKSTLAAGMAVGAPYILKGKEGGTAAGSVSSEQEIRVGFIGCGKQHKVLFDAMVNIPGIRYVAACDIMKDRLGGTFSAIKSKFGYNINRYIDAEEMMEKEAKNMDAVFVATPDFWHSPHTVMALEAGCNVYCEKMMANTLDAAKEMVNAMDRTGKLCQIGHQRRSNPRYLYVLKELIQKHKVCGDIISINGQWNRSLSASGEIGKDMIEKKPQLIPSADILRKYGFNKGADHKLTTEELWNRFFNWRLYTALSGGPISDLGAHQIDIFNWFMDSQPTSLMASGGRSHFKNREHFDNVMCIFDYGKLDSNPRAFYQVLTTTSAGGGYYEAFMGTEGTIEISEREAYTNIYKESGATNNDKWDELVARGFLKKAGAGQAAGGSDAIASYESAPPDKYSLPGGLNKPPHQPHIENFYQAIRGEAKLTCDARHALESELPIYYVNSAADNKEVVKFTDEQLTV